MKWAQTLPVEWKPVEGPHPDLAGLPTLPHPCPLDRGTGPRMIGREISWLLGEGEAGPGPGAEMGGGVAGGPALLEVGLAYNADDYQEFHSNVHGIKRQLLFFAKTSLFIKKIYYLLWNH